MKRASLLTGTGLVAGAALVAAAGFLTGGEATPDAEALAAGQALYAEHCAACHGAELAGQPDWKTRLPSGRLPAPPHDATGHTWHHSDDLLFRIVHDGTAAIVGNGYVSDMPGFGEVLEEAEIRAVLEYIKLTWPERERAFQQEVSQRD